MWCRWMFRGGGLAGLGQTHFHRSQELRTEMGSELPVLFRSQIQQFLINWLLSWPENWGPAFDQWPHTQMGPHTQKHNCKHTFTFHRKSTFTHTHMLSNTKMQTIQMCLINAHSTWEEDLHYFMVCRFNWSQDKMISEEIFHVVVFLFPHMEPSGIHLQAKGFVLGRELLWSWFWSWNLEFADSGCMLWWFNALLVVLCC